MAKIGLKNFLFGILTEATDGTATYGVAQKPAKAISCKVDISNNEATLYADDALAESDTSFQSGTVTLGIDDEDDQMLATLLGHNITDGEIERNATDYAPYVGLGRIITKMVGGVYKYKVEFLRKVKFSEPSQENDTKGESLEFGENVQTTGFAVVFFKFSSGVLKNLAAMPFLRYMSLESLPITEVILP